MNKRGSHIGLILSFTIFIFSIIFIYSVLEPAIKSQNQKRTVIEEFEDYFIEDVSDEFTIVLVSGNSENCIKLNDSKIGINNSFNLIAKDKEGNLVGARKESDDTIIEESNESLLWIYYSLNNLSGIQTSSENCVDGEINSIRTEKYISEESILDLYELYIEDYSYLKQSLDIPSSVEFDFNLIYSNGSSLSTKDVSAQTDIYSKEIKIQYMDSKANIKRGSIILRIW